MKKYPDQCSHCHQVIPGNKLAVKINSRLISHFTKQKYAPTAFLCLDCTEQLNPNWFAVKQDIDEYDLASESGMGDVKFHPSPCNSCGRPLLRLGFWEKRNHHCSNRCRVKLKRKPLLTEATCQYCNNSFVPKRRDAKFCSLHCRVASQRSAA